MGDRKRAKERREKNVKELLLSFYRRCQRYNAQYFDHSFASLFNKLKWSRFKPFPRDQSEWDRDAAFILVVAMALDHSKYRHTAARQRTTTTKTTIKFKRTTRTKEQQYSEMSDF